MAKELRVEWAAGGTEHTGIESQVFSDDEDINVSEWEGKLLERAAKKICWGSKLVRLGTVLTSVNVCNGKNCRSVDGIDHSGECIEEHNNAVRGVPECFDRAEHNGRLFDNCEFYNDCKDVKPICLDNPLPRKI